MTGSISDKEQREIGREVRRENSLLKVPTPVFIILGFVLFVVGMFLVILIWAPFNLWGSVTGLGAHSMVVAGFFALIGLLLIVFGLFLKIYAVQRGLTDYDKISRFVFGHVSYERGATAGLVLFLVGLGYALYLFVEWFRSGHKDLPIFEQGFAAFIFMAVGFLMITYALILSIAGEVMEKKRMQSQTLGKFDQKLFFQKETFTKETKREK